MYNLITERWVFIFKMKKSQFTVLSKWFMHVPWLTIYQCQNRPCHQQLLNVCHQTVLQVSKTTVLLPQFTIMEQ